MVKRATGVLWGLIVGLTVVRLAVGAWAELIPEEAYYWTYSQHPAWGYFDHPPMVAWTVWLGTALLGNTEIGVRLVNVLLCIVTCLLVWRTTRWWFEERVAVGAALLFVALPVFVGTGFIVTPDGPLLMFWALYLYLVSRALREDRGRYWWLAGLALGGAMLSKYYAIVLVPSTVWFLACSKTYRRWLGRWELWGAFGLAAVVFSPVIVWNAQHEWASFAFQSSRTVAQRGSVGLHVREFWVAQVLVLTPVGLGLMAVTGWQAVRRMKEDAWNFVGAFGLPVFGLFVVASFKTGVHVNWTAPAFLALLPGAAAVGLAGLEAGGKWWRRAAWVLAVMCGLGWVGFHVGISGHAGKLGYSHAGGWRKLAAAVDAVARRVEEQTGQRPFIVGADKYNTAAELGFYLQRPAECVNLYAFGGRGLGYRYWTELEELEGRPAVVVLLHPRPVVQENSTKYFTRVEGWTSLAPPSPGHRGKNAEVLVGYGYRPAGEAGEDAGLD